MRRIILLVALAFLSLLITGPLRADVYPFNNPCIFKSSVTVVNGGGSIVKAKYLYSVIVTSGQFTALQSNTIVLYDSTSTVISARQQISTNIPLQTPGQYYYNTLLQYGLTYVSSGTTSQGFQILYKEK